MAESAPLVSIVVCNYNYEGYIAKAIESALAQNYPRIELIIVDDGSTDGSRDVIESYRDRAEIIFKENEGQISAYNAALDIIKGEFVFFLDSDDRLLPNAATEVVAAFNSNLAAAKVHFRLRLIDSTGTPTGGTIPTHLASGPVSQIMLRQQCLYQSAPGSGNAYKVSVLRKLAPLPLDNQDKHGADFFAIYGCSLLGEVATAGNGAPLGEYRVHRKEDQQSFVLGNAAKRTNESERLKRRYARFQTWITYRLPNQVDLPADIFEFSIEKQDYARGLFNTNSYLEGFANGSKLLPRLAKSILKRPSTATMKLGLLVWAIFILVAPRSVGLPIARFVCNPASRGQ